MPTHRQSRTVTKPHEPRTRPAAKARSLLNGSHIALLCLALLTTISTAYAVWHPDQSAVNKDSGPSVVTYLPDKNGVIVIPELGISMASNPELTIQGLQGVATNNPSESTKRITFTTQKLREKSPGCDANTGWIGTMTRYEGAASDMHEHQHPHGSTNFDFPSFHINYQTPTETPCSLAGQSAYDPDALSMETQAGKSLWDAMLTAKPLD